MPGGEDDREHDVVDVAHEPRPIDALDDAVDLAAEVLAEYGGSDGSTRIERLARWVLLRAGGEPLVHQVERAGAVARIKVEHGSILRVGDIVAVQVAKDERHSPRDLRELAVAALRMAEIFESED